MMLSSIWIIPEGTFIVSIAFAELT